MKLKEILWGPWQLTVYLIAGTILFATLPSADPMLSTNTSKVSTRVQRLPNICELDTSSKIIYMWKVATTLRNLGIRKSLAT